MKLQYSAVNAAGQVFLLKENSFGKFVWRNDETGKKLPVRASENQAEAILSLQCLPGEKFKLIRK